MDDTRDWFVDGQIEIREGRDGEPTTLTGYAAVFGQETIIRSKDEEWREIIAPTAFDEALGRGDVIAAVNHDSSMVLGRSKAGTLKLTVDRIGLRYDVKLPNTSLGRDTVENVRNGNLPGSSFKFAVLKDGLRVQQARGGDLPLIEIRQVQRLIDVGPVVFPAYGGTTVSVRSGIEDLLREHQASLRTLAEKGVRERVRARLEIERSKAWA
jgi:HK97 family phage prohead protease